MLLNVIASKNDLANFNREIQKDMENFDKDNLLNWRISELQEDPNTGGFLNPWEKTKQSITNKNINENQENQKKYIDPFDHRWDFKMPTFSDTNENFQFTPILESNAVSENKKNNSLMSNQINVDNVKEVYDNKTEKAYSDADLSQYLQGSNNFDNLKLSEPVDQKELENQLKFFELSPNKQIELFLCKNNSKKPVQQKIIMTNSQNIQSLRNSTSSISNSIQSKSNTEVKDYNNEQTRMISTDKTEKIMKENSKKSLKQITQAGNEFIEEQYNFKENIFNHEELEKMTQNNTIQNEKISNQKERQQALFNIARQNSEKKIQQDQMYNLQDNQQLYNFQYDEKLYEFKENQNCDNNQMFIEKKDELNNIKYEEIQQDNNIIPQNFENYESNMNTVQELDLRINRINNFLNQQNINNASNQSKEIQINEIQQNITKTSSKSSFHSRKTQRQEEQQILNNKQVNNEQINEIQQFNNLDNINKSQKLSSRSSIKNQEKPKFLYEEQKLKRESLKKDLKNQEIQTQEILIKNQEIQTYDDLLPKVKHQNIQTEKPKISNFTNIDKKIKTINDDIQLDNEKINIKKDNIKKHEKNIMEQTNKLHQEFKLNEKLQNWSQELINYQKEKELLENNFQISKKEYLAEDNNISLQQEVITEKLVQICMSSRSIEKKISLAIEKNHDHRDKINDLIISECGKIFGFSNVVNAEDEHKINTKFMTIKNLQETKKKLYQEFKFLQEEKNKITKAIEEEQVLSEKYLNYKHRKQILQKEINDSEKEYKEKLEYLNQKIDLLQQNIKYHQNFL